MEELLKSKWEDKLMAVLYAIGLILIAVMLTGCGSAISDHDWKRFKEDRKREDFNKHRKYRDRKYKDDVRPSKPKKDKKDKKDKKEKESKPNKNKPKKEKK